MTHFSNAATHMPATFTTLIPAASLRALLASGTPAVVIDTSFDLADPAAGERSWRDGHLPGSLYLHLDRDLCGAKCGPDCAFRGRHPLPARAAFARTLGHCGITPATQVVVLDRQGGMYAARLWWMLRWMGHADVAVLDGGVAAWVASGGALVAAHLGAEPTADPVDGPVDRPVDGPAAVTATAKPGAAPPYPDRPPLTTIVTADELAAQLGRVRLVDARAAERFSGETEPLDAAAGHIPGALNRFFKDNLGADGRFKSAAELHAEFTPFLGLQGAQAVVHQCGSGVTACHNLLAMEHAGLPGSALYAGSWSEWSSQPSRPVCQAGRFG